MVENFYDQKRSRKGKEMKVGVREGAGRRENEMRFKG